jgi:hypothetical protein
MNASDITRMLAMFDAAYGPKMKAAERNWDLSIEVWTMALADIPWTPHGENAVSWWLKNDAWPPAPAEIRGQARAMMRAERKARENAETLERYAREDHERRLNGMPAPVAIGSGLAGLDPAIAKIRSDVIRMAANLEISWRDVDAEFERQKAGKGL